MNEHGVIHTHEHLSPPGRPWLRAGVWLSLSLLALWVLIGGHSDLYIAPNVRWTLWLASAAGVVIAAIDGYVAWRRGDRPRNLWQRVQRCLPGRRQRLAYGFLFAPFVVGLFVPPLVLGAGSILSHDGVVTLIPAPRSVSTGIAGPSSAPLAIDLLQLQDRMRAGASLQGSPLAIEGFVYHQPGLPPQEALLARFITPHCVAEAQPVALVLRLPDGSPQHPHLPANNTWVHVIGTLSAGTANGQAASVLDIRSLTTIAIPLDPYLVY
jgi:uncharacterized repeat protein (TIGR03943 family)